MKKFAFVSLMASIALLNMSLTIEQVAETPTSSLNRTMASADNDHTITLTVSGIRSEKGQLVYRIFRDKKSYDDEKPAAEIKVSKAKMKNGAITFNIEHLETGIYGIAILDDENKNGEMDKGFLLPKEGFGFVDYQHTGMRKPSFESFKFKLDSDRKSKVKMRYL